MSPKATLKKTMLTVNTQKETSWILQTVPEEEMEAQVGR